MGTVSHRIDVDAGQAERNIAKLSQQIITQSETIKNQGQTIVKQGKQVEQLQQAMTRFMSGTSQAANRAVTDIGKVNAALEKTRQTLYASYQTGGSSFLQANAKLAEQIHTQEDARSKQWANARRTSEEQEHNARLARTRQWANAQAQVAQQAQRAAHTTQLLASNMGRFTGESSHITTATNRMSLLGAAAHRTSGAIGLTVRTLVGFGAAGVVLNKIRQTFQGLQAEIEAFGEKNKTQEQWDAQFAQLSGGDPKKQAEFIRQRKEFQMMGGTPAGPQGATEAAKAIFKMESAGVNTPQIRELMAGMYGILEGNMGEVAANIGSAMKAMPGEKHTFGQMLSKALIAQIPSPGTATEILEAFKSVAPQADLLGISDEETLAFIGSIAQQAGGAKVAGDWINQYLKSFSREGMTEGKSSAEQVKWLTELDLPSAQYAELLGQDTVQWLYQWANDAKVKKGRTAAGIEKRQILKGADLKEILQGIVARGGTTAELEQDLSPQLLGMIVEDIGTFGDSFRGQGLAEIQARADRIFKTPAQSMKFFGERIQAEDARHYFRQVQEMQVSPSGVEYSYPKMLADLERGNTTDVAGPMMAGNAQQPGPAASKMFRKSEARFDVQMESIGALKNIASAAVKDYYGVYRPGEQPIWGKVKGGAAAYTLKTAMEMIETFAGQEKMIDLVGSPEQQTLAAGVKAAYAERPTTIGGKILKGGEGILPPDSMAKMKDQIVRSDETRKAMDEERAKLYDRSPLPVKVGMRASGAEVPNHLAIPGSYKQYSKAAEYGFSAINELNAKTAPPPVSVKPIPVKDEEAVSLLRKLHVQRETMANTKTASASVIPGGDLIEKAMIDAFTWIKNKISPETMPVTVGVDQPGKKGHEQYGKGYFTSAPFHKQTQEEETVAGNPAFETLLPQSLKREEFWKRQGGRPSEKAPRDRAAWLEAQKNPDSGALRSAGDWFTSMGDWFQTEEHSYAGPPRSIEQRQADRGMGTKLEVVNAEDTSLLKRAVTALERIVATSPSQSQPPGGFRRGNPDIRSIPSRAPQPILRER